MTEERMTDERLRELHYDHKEGLGLSEAETDELFWEINRLREREVELWVCPDCAFAFDAIHTDADTDEHSCPHFAELRLRDQNRELAECLRWYAGKENYSRTEEEYHQGYAQEIMWDKGIKARDMLKKWGLDQGGE